MDFKEILKRAAAGEQLVPSQDPLSEEEKIERLKQREMAMEAGMQAGPMMGTVKNFGGIMRMVQGGKQPPKPLHTDSPMFTKEAVKPTGKLKEFAHENPSFKDSVSPDDAVRQMTKMSMERKTPSLPSKEMSKEQLDEIMRLFGGK